MVHRLRQLLLVLTAFAFIGGASSERAGSATGWPLVMAGLPCAMTMSHAGMSDEQPMPPCKGMSPYCKHMGGVAYAALPARTMNLDLATRFSTVDYWSAWSKPADFVREPEPVPPRTI